MDMIIKLSNFLDNFENPFFVGSLVENRVLFVNKIASKIFGVTAETCDYEKIFSTSNTRLRDVIEEQVKEVSQTMIYNCNVTKGDGKTMMVDLQLGFFNEEKTEIFMEMISRKDVSKKMAIFQVDKSLKPEAILEYDDHLTVYHSNQHFFDLFGAIKETFYDNYQNKLANIFPKEQKHHLLEQIQQSLQENDNCTLETQVLMVSGELKWFHFDFQRRNFDETGEKLLCYATCIQAEQAMKDDFNLLNQYFDALHTISNESIYTIDIETRILAQKGKVAEELGIPLEVPGYPESVYGLMHPDDLEGFKEFAQNALNGVGGKVAVRVIVGENQYNWYELISKIIRDSSGNPKKIIGKMYNIQEEQQLKEEFSLVNQYFNAMQSLSKDIMYRVDVKTMTLYHMVQSGQADKLSNVIPDYVNTFINEKIIHPDDVQRYLKESEEWFEDKREVSSVRAAIHSEEYEWYSVSGVKIFDKEGNLVEILGKMENIQERKDLEHKSTHDLMTDVLNKISFENSVEQILTHSTNTEKHALIFIDLDDFKGVNDNLGHGFGDALLISVGERLKKMVRDTDLVGRVGGDEFVVFLRNIDSDASALVRTNLLLEELQEKFSFQGTDKTIKASLGIAIYPEHGMNYKDLVSKSDIALYASKGKGKNVATMYKEELEEY